MKRSLLCLSLALSLAGASAFAQEPQPAAQPSQQPPMRQHRAPDPQRQAARLTRALNLTPDQASKLEPILANRDQQMRAIFQNQQLAPQDRHQQLKALQQTTQQQLAGVLTPAQLEQMKAMRHGHRGRWNEPQQPTAPPAV